MSYSYCCRLQLQIKLNEDEKSDDIVAPPPEMTSARYVTKEYFKKIFFLHNSLKKLQETL